MMTGRRVLALGVALAGLAACRGPAPGAARVIILGIDGMDHRLLGRLMSEGRTPNLKALADRGAFLPLETTVPPQSPVAWSTVQVGAGPEVHGIFDFVHRDPRTLTPYLSIARVSEPRHLRLGGCALPLGGGHAEQLRRGAPFWQLLGARGVPATVLKMPANFPPDESSRSRTLAGMGTPDLLGTYGTFQLLTDDPARRGREVRGGLVHWLEFGGGQTAAARLTGPPDPFSARNTPLTVPVTVARDAQRDVVLVRVGDEERLLQPGEWSDWVPLAFRPTLGRSMAGMVRLFVRQVHPHLVLYVSPLNVDPLRPALPIAAPRAYATELAEALGRFHTLGMPEDTKALAAGVLGPDDFLAAAELILRESEALLWHELRRFRAGVLFAYFSTLDESSHVFWRSLDPAAPLPERAQARVIPDLYARLDRTVGEVVRAAGPATLVLVISDHGFAPFDRRVDLNAWLERRGYLAVRPPAAVRSGALGHIDWPHTQAYALGLNALYLNLRGREAEGVVPPEEREEVLGRLARELEAFVDPETGAKVVVSARRPGRAADPSRAPDLIVGYARGYRISDESAIGTVGERVVERNRDVWSGDHCMDQGAVPGVLVASRPLGASHASLADIAPTVLGVFGLPPGPGMTGTDLFTREQRR
jgi:predicted AlkP superfamily phosphohydrolase/phosphomutase